MHVATRAEVAAGASQYDGADLVGVSQTCEDVPQFFVDLERERILALRPIQSNRGHSPADLPADLGRVPSAETHLAQLSSRDDDRLAGD